MGRRQHLARLALGRSAFETNDEDENATEDVSRSQPDDAYRGPYQQQYDSKGRPINPAIEIFNSNLRDAKNAVLELVGVVERKDRTEHANQLEQLRLRHRRTKRDALLEQEEAWGEFAEYVLIPMMYLCKWWPNSFLERIQIGYYGSCSSMIDVLAMEWARLCSGDVWFFLANLLPDVRSGFVLFAIKTTMVILTEQIAGRLQDSCLSLNYSRKTSPRIHDAIPKIADCFLYAVDAILLPLDFHICTQGIGLAPPAAQWPTLRSLSPRSSSSVHRYIWKPTTTFRPGLSPGPAWLIILDKLLTSRSHAEDDSTPILAPFTTFRHPKIDETLTSPAYLTRHPQSLSTNPITTILQTKYLIRQQILAWCNWRPTDPLHHPEGTNPQKQTRLALLPARTLAQQIDTHLTRILLLPFHTLLLRTVARTYSIHNPQNPPPNLSLLTSQTRTSWKTHFSQLILGIAINAAVDVGLFLGVYRVVRYFGMRDFGWGDAGRVWDDHTRNDAAEGEGDGDGITGGIGSGGAGEDNHYEERLSLEVG